MCLYACLPVCLYVCLSECLSVCLYVCLSVCLNVCMHACMYVKSNPIMDRKVGTWKYVSNISITSWAHGSIFLGMAIYIYKVVNPVVNHTQQYHCKCVVQFIP